MQLNPLAILRAIVMFPVRVVSDMITFVTNGIVPFIVTILSSTPLNILVIASVALMMLMYFISEPFVWGISLYWDVNSLLMNIGIFAYNNIILLGWTFLVPIWNDGLDFVNLVISYVWDAICTGTVPFEDIGTCEGFNLILVTFDIITKFGLQTWNFSTGFIITIVTIITTNICLSPNDCSNVCSTPSCSSFTEYVGNFDEGVERDNQFNNVFVDIDDSEKYSFEPGLEAPGEFKKRFPKSVYRFHDFSDPFIQESFVNMVNYRMKTYKNSYLYKFKDYLSSTDIYFAQIIGKIIVAFLQWLIVDVIPTLLVIMAAAMDLFELFISYFEFLFQWMILLLSKFFGGIVYVFLRAVKSTVEGELSFDPDYYKQNLTTFEEINAEEIQGRFVDDHMGSTSNLFIEDLVGIGDSQLKEWFIGVYMWIKSVLDSSFQAGMLAINIGSKLVCTVWNLGTCLKLDWMCDLFVKPPKKCLIWTRYTDLPCNDLEPNDPNYCGDAWYRRMRYISGLRIAEFSELYHMWLVASGGLFSISSDWLDAAPSFCIDPVTGEDVGEIFRSNIFITTRWYGWQSCLDSSEWLGFDGHAEETKVGGEGAVWNDGGTLTRCPGDPHDPTGYGVTCTYKKNEELDLPGGGHWHSEDEFQGVKSFFCAHEWEWLNGGVGILYPHEKIWSESLLFLDDLIAFFGGDIWNDIHSLFFWLHGECKTWFQGDDCPCNKCPTDPSQWEHTVDVYILGDFFGYGYDCNSNHPIEEERCCWEYSIQWFIDGISEAFTLDYMDDIIIVT